MKKCISRNCALTIALVSVLGLFVPAVSATDEAIQIPLSYYDSTTCKVSDGGGTYHNNYPLDGDFTTYYKSLMTTGGYYTVALDGLYELSTMKIYQGYARSDYSRMNKVYISEDGESFTEVTDVSISATNWLTNAETNFVTVARIDYVFSAGTKAKFVKVTNDLTSPTEVSMAEMRIYGVKQKEPVTPGLTSLTVSSGELAPAFNKAVTDYTVSVGSLKDAVPEISAAAAEGCTLAVTQPSRDNGYVGSVLVYETDNADNQKLYTVTIVEVREPRSVPLTYHDSIPCKVSDSGGTYDKLYPLDGDFSTNFKSNSVVGGYYTVAFDGEYELSTMKIYHNYAHSDYSRLNKVYVSDNGTDFTEVTDVTIKATSWLKNEETAYNQVVRVDYTFPKGVTAQYLKVTNDLITDTEFRMTEMFVYGYDEFDVTPVALNISADNGILSPAFRMTVTEYALSVGSLSDEKLPKLSVTVSSRCAADIIQPSPDNGYVGTILVYEKENESNNRLYSVGLKEAECITPQLVSLTADRGTLSPGFNANVYEYELLVDTFESFATLTAKAMDGCSVEIEQPYPRNDMIGTITVWQDVIPSNTKTYTVKMVSERDSDKLHMTYVDSTLCKGSDSGGTYDKLNPIDGILTTAFKSASVVVGGYYTVALDCTYELTTMKIYQDYGQLNGDWIYRLNSVEVSDDGEHFTPVEGVKISSPNTWIRTPETGYDPLARVDYVFPEGVKAKYVKITTTYEGAVDFRLNEIYLWGRDIAGFDETALKQLDSSSGITSPAFDKDVTEYRLTVESFAPDKLPVFTAKAARSGDVVTAVQPSAKNCYTGSFTVTNQANAQDQKEYRVRLTTKNPELSADYITDQSLSAIRRDIYLLTDGVYLIGGKLTNVSWNCDSAYVDIQTGRVMRQDENKTVRITAQLQEVDNPQNKAQKVFTLTLLANEIKSPVLVLRDDFHSLTDGSGIFEGDVQKDGDGLVMKGEASYESKLVVSENIHLGNRLLFDFEIQRNAASAGSVTLRADQQIGLIVHWDESGCSVTSGEMKTTNMQTKADKLRFRLELLENNFNLLADSGEGYYVSVMQDAEYIQPIGTGIDTAAFASADGETTLREVCTYVSAYDVCNIAIGSINFAATSDEKPLSVTKNLHLIKNSLGGTKLVWSSSDETVIKAATGTVLLPETGRYVNLKLQAQYGEHSAERTFRLHVGGQNLLEGAKVSASAAALGDSRAANLLDESADTAYIVQNSNVYEINIKLPEEKTISHIDMFSADTQDTIEVFSILVSADGRNYTHVYTGQTLTDFGSFPIPITKAKHIRVMIEKTSGTSTGIAEILAFYQPTAAQLAAADLTTIQMPSEWKETVTLPLTGENGSSFSYSCNLSAASFTQEGNQVLFNVGSVKYDTVAVVTVKAQNGSESATKTFEIKVNGSGGNTSGGSSGGGGGSSSGGGSGLLNVSFKPSKTEQAESGKSLIDSEIENSWAKDEISYLYQKGIIKGNGDSLALDETVSRAELAAMLLRAQGVTLSAYTGRFSDVAATAWYADTIETACRIGLVEGFDGKARPEERVTREEMAKMLVKALGRTEERGTAGFSDEAQISPWARGYVQTAFVLGLIQGYEDNSFCPQNGLKRVEAMVVVYRLLTALQAG